MLQADVLRYLAARYAFEPLPHYAMIAVALCGEDEELPPFARGSLHWLAWRFIQPDERKVDARGKTILRAKPAGAFPEFLTTNEDKASDQWRRVEDCALFLADEQAALEYQAHRLRLVMEYKERLANKASRLDIRQYLEVQIGAEYAARDREPPFNISEYAIERRWEAVVGQQSGFEDDLPVALTETGEIAFLTPDGEIVRR